MSYLKEKLPEFSPAVVEMERTFSPDLKGLCEWLETQDAATRYDVYCVTDCLLCRFATAASGRKMDYLDAARLCGDGAEWTRLYKAAYGGNRTYGEALRSARAALESQS